jgi:hypothetical protein
MDSAASSSFSGAVKLEVSSTGSLQAITLANASDFGQIAAYLGLGGLGGAAPAAAPVAAAASAPAAKRQREDAGHLVQQQMPAVASQDDELKENEEEQANSPIPPPKRRRKFQAGAAPGAASGARKKLRERAPASSAGDATVSVNGTEVGDANYSCRTIKVDDIQYVVIKCLRKPDDDIHRPMAGWEKRYPELKRLYHIWVQRCGYNLLNGGHKPARFNILLSIEALRNIVRIKHDEALESEIEENRELVDDLRRIAPKMDTVLCEKAVAALTAAGF